MGFEVLIGSTVIHKKTSEIRKTTLCDSLWKTFMNLFQTKHATKIIWTLYRLYGFNFLPPQSKCFWAKPFKIKSIMLLIFFCFKPFHESVTKLTNAENTFWRNPKSKTKDELLSIVVLNCNKAYYEKINWQTQKCPVNPRKAWQTYQNTNSKITMISLNIVSSL